MSSYPNLEKLRGNAHYTGYCEGAIYRVVKTSSGWRASSQDVNAVGVHTAFTSRKLGDISAMLNTRARSIIAARAIVQAHKAQALCEAQAGYGTPAYRGDPMDAVALQQSAAALRLETIERAARELLDAFGGLAPDWIRDEAAALETALEA